MSTIFLVFGVYIMWGCISAESSYQFNFNTCFSSTRSDVLLHLAQWQYWWWFWFAFLWSFYYLLMLKIIRFRTLKMKPKIVTSFRPHGKWGDFLAAIIPSLWCLNILTNSNFILRLIEWQNESSLFLVRVRGKQWYWIYKFEMKNLIDILSVPKNIGKNKWFSSNFGEVQFSQNYFNTLRLKSKAIRVEDFWDTYLGGVDQNNLEVNTLFTESINDNFSVEKNLTYFNLKNSNVLNENFYFSAFFNKLKIWTINSRTLTNLITVSKSTQNHISLFNSSDYFNSLAHEYNTNIFSSQVFNVVYSPKFEIQSRFFKKNFGTNIPFRLKKTPLNVLFNEPKTPHNNLFKLKFNDGVSNLYAKQSNDIFLYTIKQMRYKRRTTIPSTLKLDKTKKLTFSGKTILLNNNLFGEGFQSFENFYKLTQKNKTVNEISRVNLSRRLLRTRRTLVLPAHINITLITNSFDVVHSWFVPGLGLKLDCVPGRSTHHTLYIDNVGFYYGQCAEICGRYHHHMPIRICALPFEHFLMWWHVFGLPRIMFSQKKNYHTSVFAYRKFLW